MHAQRHLSLVLIDPLAAFMTGTENTTSSMLAVLMPLQRLTTLGLSVLVLHHPPKGKFRAGQAARGSGALSGFADILIEMKRYPRATDTDRRRRLHAFSRFDATPVQRVIELTADGTDYLSHGTFHDEEFTSHWPLLQSFLETAPRKLTRREIRKQWPAERVPDDSTLYRLLERGVAQGVVARDGKGLRNSPFRYWLPGREEIWKQDPMNYFYMPELFDPPPSPPTPT